MLRLEIKLKEALKENNLTQKELSELTGIREAAISELSNMKRRSINVEHLEKIINELNVENISKIINIIEL
jgi:transcriptional regulator with XRE-family HTH domain